MKVFFALLIAVAFAASTSDSLPVVTEAFANELKSKVTWQVADPDKNIFNGWTIGDVKEFLGTYWPTTEDIFEYEETQDGPYAIEDVPESFDWREKMPDCVHPIRDQQSCGSCWAFGATEALSDRFCISSNKAIDVVLSPEDLIVCDNGDKGCNGGRLKSAWSYMKETGVITDGCLPYTSGDAKTYPDCPNDAKTCKDSSTWKKYKCADEIYMMSLLFSVKKKMQENILNGPIEGQFMVYKDFMSYSGGIYVHEDGELLGGHAIKIVGWGVENETEYWICQNSWGPAWGEKGYFRISMETCEISKIACCCTPSI